MAVAVAVAEAGDYGSVRDRFDAASQERMAPELRLRRLDGATDRERYVRLLERRPASRAQFLPARVVEVQRAGDQASLLLDREDPLRRGRPQRVYLTRHQGRWCLSYGADPPR